MSLEPPKITEALKAYYDKLFQDGYLVSVHVSKWGMGTQLSKDDLNLESLPKLFKLGRKMLIDPKHLAEFTSIEGKARRYLYSNSYDFPVAEAHFVPRKKVPQVVESLNKFRTEYQELTAKFIEKYEEYRDEILAEFPDIAEVLRPYYPAKETLNDKFSFSYSIFELSVPRQFGEVDIKELINQELVLDEAKEEAKAEVQKELQIQYQQSVAQLERFTEEAARALRSQIVSMCQSLIDKIARKDLVTRTSLNSVRAEIENFRTLNFLDDKAVADEIDKLEKVVDSGLDFRSDAEAIAVLNNALTETLNTANNITDIPHVRGTYFRALKLT